MPNTKGEEKLIDQKNGIHEAECDCEECIEYLRQKGEDDATDRYIEDSRERKHDKEDLD